jgi:putative transposase
MSKRFKGTYRNESARLQHWDYGNDAAYFITICTKDRACFFGEIQNGQMQVSPIGAVAYVLWNEIKNHAKNIELGEFVVMPNHVHGILILDGNNMDVDGRDVACNVPTETPLKNQKMAAISPKTNTISTIIRSYKSAVTKYCNRLELPFAWQPRFYDHIIRNDESFHRISEYIKNNPANWNEDKFY